MEGHCILPSVMKELNAKSRGLDIEYERIDHMKAEVSEGGEDGKRHVVDLDMRTCTCREFQVSGNLASITFPSSMELGGGGGGPRWRK